MTKQYQGACLCNQVSYQVDGEFDSFYLCHCKHCQKGTGSAHAANLFSSKAQLKWQKGEHKIKSFQLEGTRHMRSFCIECGSALPNMQFEGKLLVVPAGSLNTQISIKPNAHLFCQSRANWDDQLALVREFDNFPS